MILGQIIEFQKSRGQKLRVFDLGCGAGFISRAIAGLGNLVVGIDREQFIIDYAKKVTPKELEIEYYAISAEAIRGKFPAESFALLVCSEVLEHLPDPFQVSWIPKYLLKPGGLMIITIPNGYCFEERLRWFLYMTKPGKSLRRGFQ